MGNVLAFAPPRSQQTPSTRATHRLRTRAGDDVPAYIEKRPGRPLLLFCHGNSDDLDHVVAHIGSALARELNVGLYVFEYPGYTDTRGASDPSELGAYAAAEAAYDDAVKRGYARERIIVYGKSLGTGVATYLAWQRPGTGALVLVSPIESAYRTVIETNVSWPGDIMRVVDMISRQSSPTQLVHGSVDRVAPLSGALELQRIAEARSAKTYALCRIDGAGHEFEEQLDESGRMTNDFTTMIECLRDGVMSAYDTPKSAPKRAREEVVSVRDSDGAFERFVIDNPADDDDWDYTKPSDYTDADKLPYTDPYAYDSDDDDDARPVPVDDELPSSPIVTDDVQWVFTIDDAPTTTRIIIVTGRFTKAVDELDLSGVYVDSEASSRYAVDVLRYIRERLPSQIRVYERYFGANTETPLGAPYDRFIVMPASFWQDDAPGVINDRVVDERWERYAGRRY